MLSVHTKNSSRSVATGLAGWLLARFNRQQRPQPRLELIEKIALAPRQSLALVEVEGKKFLVACSADSTPAFLEIAAGARVRGHSAGRVSW